MSSKLAAAVFALGLVELLAWSPASGVAAGRADRRVGCARRGRIDGRRRRERGRRREAEAAASRPARAQVSRGERRAAAVVTSESRKRRIPTRLADRRRGLRSMTHVGIGYDLGLGLDALVTLARFVGRGGDAVVLVRATCRDRSTCSARAERERLVRRSRRHLRAADRADRHEGSDTTSDGCRQSSRRRSSGCIARAARERSRVCAERLDSATADDAAPSGASRVERRRASCRPRA